MIKLFKVLAWIFVLTTNILNMGITYGEEKLNTDQQAVYFGFEGGIVDPVISKFRHKHSNTDITLKRSHMYSGKIGYMFYPQIALEFSATYQPKYRLHYVLPEINLTNGLTIPKTPGNTIVMSNIYMLNLVYDLEAIKGVTPFVILGTGIAQVKIKPTSSRWELIDDNYFKIRRTNKNCFTWQAGVGVSHFISQNFSIDLAAKLQTVYRVKIDYDTLDITTKQFVPAHPIKKTIGVGEFGLGFTYRLPF